MRFLSRIERLFLILGLVLVTIYVGSEIHRAILSRAELKRFQDLRTRQPVEASVDFPPATLFPLDFSLWSQKRITEYERSLTENLDPPLAVLRIAKVHLEVPVLEGTDELILNRGVGHIGGTMRPGENGNIGIAGHRDGFFRVLKDVGPGDAIELVSTSRTDTYVVDQIVLVSPNDVSVLQPRSMSSLTLVTCYPFYFVGSAPQRYIVQASITNPDLPNLRVNKRASSEPRGGPELPQSTR
jgi:sortase A